MCRSKSKHSKFLLFTSLSNRLSIFDYFPHNYLIKTIFQTQLQNQTQTKSETDSSGNSRTTSTTAAMGPVKPEQRPVECNLCHRKFKNIPALNGHMRLHGGYFKKDTETKKCDKKESSGPPLQTASVGIRALIEEKIISKRGKDLKVCQFVFEIVIYNFPVNKYRILCFYRALS